MAMLVGTRHEGIGCVDLHRFVRKPTCGRF
jgi:hypothetical protein